VLQVNGKHRGPSWCPPAPTRRDREDRAGQRGFQKFAGGAAPKKVIVVPAAWSTWSYEAQHGPRRWRGALLAGCGFELRRRPTFAFDSIAVKRRQLAAAAELRNARCADAVGAGGRARPRLKVLPASADTKEARVILDLPTELREKVVVGLNSTGQVREFQLRTRIRFKLRTPQGKELIPDTEMLQQRDISFNEAAVLSKEAEEAMLYRNMQTDLVQQLMRRLAALKTL
jgi:LPS-assembly lipoprotein